MCRLFIFLQERTNKSADENQDFKSETWKPQYTHHTGKTFLEGLIEVKPNTVSLTIMYRNQNEHLYRNFKRWMISSSLKTDKGGVTIILDVEDYMAKAKRQINSYGKLDHDPTPLYTTKLLTMQSTTCKE